MAGAAPLACPRRCVPLPFDDGGRVARDCRAVSGSGLAGAGGHAILPARMRRSCSPRGALIRLLASAGTGGPRAPRPRNCRKQHTPARRGW
eukprot:scaffold17264_cov48-Phaeocystis_antarctica.AAC.1